MEPIIRKATRTQAKLRVGIAAPSGAGKTMGALLIAYGITGDWQKVGLIDTEAGSGELYVGVRKHGVTIGDFLYTRIEGKFPPKSYIDCITALEKAGAEVIIIDSLTHAWAGTDGLLDKQAKIAKSSGNSYTAWRDVTPEHNALVNAILQSNAHIIATMRSKVEYSLQKDDNGRSFIQKMGMAPVQREGMEYEFTVFLDVDSNHYASASKDRTDLFSAETATGAVEKLQFIITPETGERLEEWVSAGGTELATEVAQLIEQFGAFDTNDRQEAFIAEHQNRLRALTEQQLFGMKRFLLDKLNKTNSITTTTTTTNNEGA